MARDRLLRTIKVGVVLAVWAPGLLFGVRYAAGQTPDFVGFDMSSKATATRFTFNSPGLGLPAHPTGEVNGAHSEATLASGPAAYGLGSVAWPGQVVAALPSFIQGIIEEESGEEFPLDLPNWPLRAETFFPQGPLNSDFQLGTMVMRSQARESFSEAQAHINNLDFPVIGGGGTQTSEVSNGFDRDGAVVQAMAAATNFSLLEGLVQIGSVVSRAEARSNGTEGTVEGETIVTGAEVAGIPMTITTEGAKILDSELPGLGGVFDLINDLIADLTGISIELVEPVDLIDGARASRVLGGVIVRIDVRLVNEALSAVPPEISQPITDEVPIDQVLTVELAPLAVSAAATTLPPFDVDLPDDVPLPALGAAVPPAAPVTGSTEAPVVPAPGPAQPGTVPVAAGPELDASFAGVPLLLVMGLLAAALLLTWPLMLAADRMFAAVAGCPWEEL